MNVVTWLVLRTRYFLLFLFSSGCAAPMLTSENVMFPSNVDSDAKWYQTYNGFIRSITVENGFDRANAIKDLKNDYPEPQVEGDPVSWTYKVPYPKWFNINLATFNLVSRNASWSVSAAVPFVSLVGIDATVRLPQHFYLTAGYGGVREVVLQRRLYWTGKKGASIGMFYQQSTTEFTRHFGTVNTGINPFTGDPLLYRWDAAGVRYRLHWQEQHKAKTRKLPRRTGLFVAGGLSQDFKYPFIKAGFMF